MSFVRICISVAVVFSALLMVAPSAQAGWFDFLYPSIKPKGPDPAVTLKAPFADEDAVIVDIDASGNASNQTPLHLRHRTNDTITLWVQKIVPEMVSYKAAEYEGQYKAKVSSFNKVGLDEYVNFLNERNFFATLKTGRYNIAGFISDYPVILNEGAIDGSYRWLYQMDIMVTYIDNRARNYKDIKSGDSISHEFTLVFQIGRSRDAVNEHGLIIESWDVKPKVK